MMCSAAPARARAASRCAGMYLPSPVQFISAR
jgi:hypothetical protein